jgi:hypothetical protein
MTTFLLGRKTRTLAPAALALALITPAQAASTCKVTDPTGTPMNVRSEPNSNSRIVRTLKNGTTVIIGQLSEDGRWVEVIPVIPQVKPKFDKDDLPIFDGWVFEKYLNNGKCYPHD